MAITIDYMVSQNKSFLPPPLLFLYDDRIHIFGRTTRFICKIKKEISPEWEFVKKKHKKYSYFFNLPEKTHISRLFGKQLSMRGVELIFSNSVFLKYKLTPVILWKLMISQSWIRKISQRGQFFVLILESFICQHFFEWNVGNKIQSQKGQNTQLNVFTVKREEIHSYEGLNPQLNVCKVSPKSQSKSDDEVYVSKAHLWNGRYSARIKHQSHKRMGTSKPHSTLKSYTHITGKADTDKQKKTKRQLEGLRKKLWTSCEATCLTLQQRWWPHPQSGWWAAPWADYLFVYFIYLFHFMK